MTLRSPCFSFSPPDSLSWEPFSAPLPSRARIPQGSLPISALLTEHQLIALILRIVLAAFPYLILHV